MINDNSSAMIAPTYYKIELVISSSTMAMLKWDNSHKSHCNCNHACIPVRKLIEEGKYEKVDPA